MVICVKKLLHNYGCGVCHQKSGHLYTCTTYTYTALVLHNTCLNSGSNGKVLWLVEGGIVWGAVWLGYPHPLQELAP